MTDYREWIKRAKSSFKYSKAKIDDDIYYEDRCGKVHEAVEKAFKGLLMYYGAIPERTHDLRRLCLELRKYTIVPKEIELSVILNPYAVETKYPGDFEVVTEKEYLRALEIAQLCLDWVDIRITENKGD